jgi:4-hydroxy-2-oxoheptanedioate aldolase
MGWAVRDYLNNTLGWPAAKPLWNTAKQKLLDGKKINAWSTSSPSTELYCQMAPHYDFVWIEMQHSTLSWADAARLIAACPHAGATPMIRLPDELESTLQKATDIGALGMIEPTTDTVEKALAVARYSRYPPFGRRSQGGGQSGSIWGINGVNYRQEVNANTLVVLMIETPVGVANALEIARVPGVDVVLEANTDLGNFSGFEETSKEYQDMVTKIHDAVLKAGKFLGATHVPEGPTMRSDGADFRMFQNPPTPNDGFVPPAPARGSRGSGSNQ